MSAIFKQSVNCLENKLKWFKHWKFDVWIKAGSKTKFPAELGVKNDWAVLISNTVPNWFRPGSNVKLYMFRIYLLDSTHVKFIDWIIMFDRFVFGSTCRSIRQAWYW